MISRSTIYISALSMFVSSCATQATLAPLHDAQLQCQVQHNPDACAAVPILQANANEEANHNALLTVGLVLLLPLAILAIGASNPEPDTVVIVHRGY